MRQKSNMAKIPRKVQLDPTTVSDDSSEAVEAVALALNPFIEDVVSALTGALDFNNINFHLVNSVVTVDVNGTVTSGGEAKNPYQQGRRINGLICIKAATVSGSAIYPTSTPFLTYVSTGEKLSITNVTGLPAGVQFLLTILVL